MEAKPSSRKVVSLADFAEKRAASFDARAATNASASPGDRIAQSDENSRAARFLGRTSAPQQQRSAGASVLMIADGRYAGQIAAMREAGNIIDAFGLYMQDVIERTELPAHTPYTEESKTLRLDSKGNPL